LKEIVDACNVQRIIVNIPFSWNTASLRKCSHRHKNVYCLFDWLFVAWNP